MIRGLLAKTFHEVWLSTMLFSAALLLVMALLTYIVPQLRDVISGVFAQLPLARMMLGALLGIDVEQEMTAQMLQAFVWVHPVVLAIVWAQEIVYCTRLPAAEIEQGTIDVLLGLPVSRRAVYVSDSIMWLLSGALLLLFGLAGYWIGSRSMPPEMRPGLTRILLVLCNLYCVYVAVGGVAYVGSAANSRRGPAVAIVFSLVVGSFLLTFLARFWQPAGRLAFLSVLDYYHPAIILRSGELPVRDVTTLLVVGGLAWILGCEILSRRSICTV